MSKSKPGKEAKLSRVRARIPRILVSVSLVLSLIIQATRTSHKNWGHKNWGQACEMQFSIYFRSAPKVALMRNSQGPELGSGVQNAILGLLSQLYQIRLDA